MSQIVTTLAAKNNKSDIIFKSRTSINNYMIERLDDSIYLLITGTSRDSNKDKFLNSEDLQELFVYNSRFANIQR